MAELKERILDIVNSPTLAGFATITPEGKPWVRYVMATADDNLTVRFPTHLSTRKVAHIQANTNVHLTCGVSDPLSARTYLQIEGTATLTIEEAVRHAVWFPMLAQVFEGPDDPNFGIVEVTPTRIELVTAGSMEPEVWTAE